MDTSQKSTSQVIGLYTGALKVDQISKVRFNNDKNYVNKLLPVRDGFNYSNVAISPTPSTEKLLTFGNTTNGMQFQAKNHSTDKFDSLSYYKQDHLTILNFVPSDEQDSDYSIALDSYKSDPDS